MDYIAVVIGVVDWNYDKLGWTLDLMVISNRYKDIRFVFIYVSGVSYHQGYLMVDNYRIIKESYKGGAIHTEKRGL